MLPEGRRAASTFQGTLKRVTFSEPTRIQQALMRNQLWGISGSPFLSGRWSSEQPLFFRMNFLLVGCPTSSFKTQIAIHLTPPQNSSANQNCMLESAVHPSDLCGCHSCSWCLCEECKGVARLSGIGAVAWLLGVAVC